MYRCRSSELRETFLTIATEQNLLNDAMIAFEHIRQSSSVDRLREIFDLIRIEIADEWKSYQGTNAKAYENLVDSILNAIFIMAECAKYNQIETIHTITNVMMGLQTKEQRFNAVHLVLPKCLQQGKPLSEARFRRYIENFERCASKKVESPMSPPAAPISDDCSICLEVLDAHKRRSVLELPCKVLCNKIFIL